MRYIHYILASAFFISHGFANAQTLAPTLGSEFEYCKDRPTEPDWMAELPSREKYKRLVIQTIYRAQSLERVVEANDCACATRFPAWEAAVQHFNDNYLLADRNALREAEKLHFDRFNELRPTAREICEAAGNW